MRLFSVFLLIFVIFSTLIFATDILLKPLSSTVDLPEVAMILVQGSGIKPEAYQSIAIEFQNALSDYYALWVGIPEFPGDVAEPVVLDDGIERMLNTMYKAGLDSKSPLVMAGHSLGGAMVQTWTDSHAKNVTAQILMGSFLTRVYKTDYVFSYSVPTLTIGGELDGLARATRIAEAYYTQILDPYQDQSSGEANFPVTIIPGVSHMEFAEGQPPEVVQKRDLKPEISYEEAHKLIAADAATFLRTKLNSSDITAQSVLSSRLQDTREFINPILDAFHLEGYHNFRPPCYCRNDTCNPDPDCTAGCFWSDLVSQPTMGSGLEGLTITNQDSFHQVWKVVPDPLPTIFNTCEKPDGCNLSTTSVTEGLYRNGEDLEIWRITFDDPKMDSGYLPITAVELKTKLSSRQNVYTHAGLKDQDFDELDGGNVRCGEINQQALDYAFAAAATWTVNRFNAVGQPYRIASDLEVCPPCWIWKELQYDEVDDGSGRSSVELSSPQYSSPIDLPLKISAGFHFCKVLSPARAIEWIYVDGLRKYYSLNSTDTFVPIISPDVRIA
eukprot:TRINITY_DN1421_c0_g1_i2.p1 TRINITY_DN1421_c0_g1~~TRINITY_DN1421_c0_g1_i2.p1  ORF type:complete len:555 (+),score=122.90 TRINITY_DN1421_c0_g1_i2:119-1783(+)